MGRDNGLIFMVPRVVQREWLLSLVVSTAVLLVAAVPVASAESLHEALSSAYQYNPRLDAERARLRATDENVTQAMSGYRPKADIDADVGIRDQVTRPSFGSNGTSDDRGYTVSLQQPIFRGFRTTNAVNRAEAGVRAGRESLRNIEQTVLLDTVLAYVDVVRDQAIVRLRENNVKVLSRELKATKDRFAVGEVTVTDVAQAEARRAGTISALDLSQANLKSSRARFEQEVGHAPQALIEARVPRSILPKSLDAAQDIGLQESPAVVSSLYLEQSARYLVDEIRGELLPEINVEASYTERFDSSPVTEESETGIVRGRLTMPLYEGGAIYSRVRQAKHTHVSTIQEVERAKTVVKANIVAAWSQLQAASAKLESDTVQVNANRTALSGVREEEKVGQRTLLDVLDAEQELLDAEVQLVSTKRDVVFAAYALLAAVGHLDAAGIGAAATVYDPEAHYFEVRRQWFGLDITHDDGRREHLEAIDTQADHVPVK